MSDLRLTIAKNICELRTNARMTQQAFAEIFNYSDKAISKWERGEALPDVTVLKQIADYFGITVDYLLEEDHASGTPEAEQRARLRRRNHLLISILAVSCVWFVATAAFVILVLSESTFSPWLSYIYALPVSAVVAVVFNSIWGVRRVNFPIVSVLIWGVILSVYLTAALEFYVTPWEIFIIGIPLQFSAIFLPGIGLFRFRPTKK